MPGEGRGNRTERRGRKLRKDIHLSDDARMKLRRIWTKRSMYEPGLTEDEIVNELVLQSAEPVAPATAITEWHEGEIL
jgi:hypothetical protein